VGLRLHAAEQVIEDVAACVVDAKVQPGEYAVENDGYAGEGVQSLVRHIVDTVLGDLVERVSKSALKIFY
jgi:hypothetical protein